MEVTKMIEALKLLSERIEELNNSKDFYKNLLAKEREENEKFQEDRKKQREDRKKQNNVHAQQLDMLQNTLVTMTQTFQVRELQHSKELDEL